MQKSNQLVVELQRGDLLPLDDARGARVSCIEGALWITQHNDGNDVIVQAGETFEVERDGRTVVQAMDASRAMVAAAVSAAGSSGKGLPLRTLLPRAARA